MPSGRETVVVAGQKSEATPEKDARWPFVLLYLLNVGWDGRRVAQFRSYQARLFGWCRLRLVDPCRNHLLSCIRPAATSFILYI
jgi:hypothetical protein